MAYLGKPTIKLISCWYDGILGVLGNLGVKVWKPNAEHEYGFLVNINEMLRLCASSN